ncbi:unnamed protein product [Arabis nemorensis]|uniref:Uncharacterized protein n=1 Tax=Arabis nemorensis TaxID=586526 RepID=A0A565BZF4_9BRAS|nr:unnamed protein product [Arabis nemorensis]
MRIRKNTKLSSLLLATAGYGGDRPETYMCHFNQSPWDVIPVTSSVDGDGSSELPNLLDSSWFLPSPSSSPPPLIHQFDGEEDNSLNRNLSLGNSNGVAQRLTSSVVSVEGLNLIAAEDYDRSPDVDEPMDRSDNSGKKSEPVATNSPVKTSGDEEEMAVSMPAPPKRGRPRGTGKKAPAFTAASTNPYEFYYYSGFGPRWGRKRGGSGDGDGDGENMVVCEDDNNNVSKKSSSSSDDKTASFGDGSSSVDGFDYVEEGNSNDL